MYICIHISCSFIYLVSLSLHSKMWGWRVDKCTISGPRNYSQSLHIFANKFWRARGAQTFIICRALKDGSSLMKKRM